MMKELFEHNGNLYVVLKKIPISQLTLKNNKIDSELFNGWKEYLGAEKVLKTQTHFLYCESVIDLEWEDIPAEETNEPVGPGI